ncbi:2Fe-2S iron-sulfur cluster-binding protein [uncultured Marinobacter sp.]|uniref:(2Fe-2S)-binding protein n=1 Tax=uncultured Marinobacter sp. TaxID=187379 RepID=UPI0030D6D216
MSDHYQVPETPAQENISFELNGEAVTRSAPSAETLLDILRESGQITSARAGCRVGRCGACQVLLDGRAVPSCLVMAWQLPGHHVETVEGLNKDPDFLSVRDALASESALQCGYCTPGFAVSLVAGIRQRRQGSTVDLTESVAGNLCRCTGYGGLRRAIDQLSAPGCPDEADGQGASLSEEQ